MESECCELRTELASYRHSHSNSSSASSKLSRRKLRRERSAFKKILFAVAERLDWSNNQIQKVSTYAQFSQKNFYTQTHEYIKKLNKVDKKCIKKNSLTICEKSCPHMTFSLHETRKKSSKLRTKILSRFCDLYLFLNKTINNVFIINVLTE